MAHKKYIKRGNKVFGPYLYENYRENGITKTRYLGKGEGKREIRKRNKLRVNKKIIFLVGIVILVLILGGIFLSQKNEQSEEQGELFSVKGLLNLFVFKTQDFFSVNVNVVQNTRPEILNLPSEAYVCENRQLRNVNFTVIDQEGDALTFHINPPYGIFRVRPESSLPRESFPPGVSVELYTWRTLLKQDVNYKRVPLQGYALYEEVVTAADSFLADNEEINITLIEVNNLEIENIGVQTIWTHGDNTTFYYEVQVDDPENLLKNFNISFEPQPDLFNISSSGVMNFTANESHLPVGENSTTYNVTVCVNDSGLPYPAHPRYFPINNNKREPGPYNYFLLSWEFKF
jgi:hypothetical protein